MKHMRKSIALFLAVLMTLSVLSVIGFAEDGTDPATTYTVTFYNSVIDTTGEKLPEVIPGDAYTQTVPAGGSATDPFAGLSREEIRALGVLVYPEESDDDFDIWGFTGWDRSLDNVTEDLKVYPTFTEKFGKLYEIVYHNYDGSEISTERCVIGMHLSESPVPVRPTDDRYFYKFAGWSLKQGIDPAANKDDAKYLLDWSDNMQLPRDEDIGQVPGQPGYINLYGKDSDEYIPLHVYAYFTRHNVEYTLSLTVLDSYGSPVNHAAVQVRSASGQLLDQTYAARDEEGNLTGGYKAATGYTNDKGQITMKLPYQTEYTIEASYTDTDEGIIKKVTVSDLKQGVTITLTPAAGYHEEYKPRCTCVCHSFIGGLWITALNVMHYLFKVKYVCCYDMYATHGDRLSYAA